MTLAEEIQEKMKRRDELRVELEAVEKELIDAGSILVMTVKTSAFLRRRTRGVTHDSIRAKVLAVVSDNRDWHVRDIISRIPMKPESVRTQISRMTIEGDLIRVSHGVVRKSVELPTQDAVA